MAGPELLARVKRDHPNVVRLVLSGHSELEPALRALSISHQFLSKPCTGEVLVDVVDRACEVQSLVSSDAVRGLVGSIGDLPARPKVYSEVTKLLASETASLAALADLVEQDIGIATKLLHMVNTAFFSNGRVIKSVRDAVQRLGTGLVRDLVLGIEVFRDQGKGLHGFSIDQMHEHSMRCAALARRIADRAHADDAFLAGTLHEVGQLVLATTLPDAFARAVDRCRQDHVPLYEAERRELGVGHSEVGAYLLGLWGMPYAVIEAVAHHHHPGRITTERCDAVTAVYVADALLEELDGGEDASGVDLDHLASLGLAGRLEDWRALARTIGEEVP